MIFVTGATGMVGANLIALFERNNVEYKALKRKSSTLNIVKNVFKLKVLMPLLKSMYSAKNVTALATVIVFNKTALKAKTVLRRRTS